MALHRLAFLALILVGAGANAQTTLTISDQSDKATNNPEDVECIIWGNSCPPGAQSMSSYDYTQKGSISDFDVTAGPNNAKGKGESKVVVDYTVGYLATFVGKVFDIGIDVNTAAGQPAELLHRFEVLVNGAIKFVFDGGANGYLLDPNFNGNGYFDFLLSTVDLSTFKDEDKVVFRAKWSRATDGAENFFIVKRPVTVPEPPLFVLFLTGLSLMMLSSMARRRRQNHLG